MFLTAALECSMRSNNISMANNCAEFTKMWLKNDRILKSFFFIEDFVVVRLSDSFHTHINLLLQLLIRRIESRFVLRRPAVVIITVIDACSRGGAEDRLLRAALRASRHATYTLRHAVVKFLPFLLLGLHFLLKALRRGTIRLLVNASL